MKTLESSIADRLNELTTAKPSDRDAFINHMTILERVEEVINDADGSLYRAADRMAKEFGVTNEVIVARVIARLTPTQNDSLKAA